MRALTVYRSKDGLWCAQITFPQWQAKAKYAKSQKETRDWLVQKQNTVRQGVWTDADSLTVEVFLNQYLSIKLL